MDKILFIDGFNALHRACVKFGKVDPNVDDSVIFTFNFFRNLRPLIEDFSPVKCYFVLEGHPQFRYDLYADYKANRIIKQASKQKSKDKFLKMKNVVLPLMQYLPITVCKADAYEADDVIASLAENMKDEDITIISNDSDYIQLLQRGYKSCNIYNPIKKTFMEAPIYPYIAWKCLAGDKSDNIPTLLKPKNKADELAVAMLSNLKLFKEFMDVEENRANFSINRRLIEFRQVPMEEIIMSEGQSNFNKLKEHFTEMDFQSIINPDSWNKYVKTFDCIKF